MRKMAGKLSRCNIVLSQVKSPDLGWQQGSFPPLGLMYIGASVQNLPGVKVRMVDGLNERLDIEQTARRILELEPDIIGLTLISRNFLESLEVIRLVKEARPEVCAVCGGIHASLFDDLLLGQSPDLDLVVKGEGEESFPELVRRVMAGESCEGIPGVSCRANGTIVRAESQIVEDLDALAFPDRKLAETDGYGTQFYGFDLPQLPKTATFYSSRGCPYHCLFCSDTALNAHYRARSPENVLAELKEANAAGYEVVVFWDDNFTGDVERINRLCNLIIESDLKQYYAVTGMPSQLPDETLRLMNRAGFIVMFVGVESGSDVMLRKYRKPADSEKTRDGIIRTQKANIIVIASFITGHRDETEADHQASKEFISRAKPFFAEINPLMAHPGSRLWNEVHANQGTLRLDQTRSKLISNFPEQMDKKTIKYREKDFRRHYQQLWRNGRMWLGFLRAISKNRLLRRLIIELVKHPAFFLQLARGGRTRK
ncbi:MAG: B12-binding domain-containing radical SAM protein [bacterium]|nr:B12-binding domain-containing radical SAM protein [bacterium]